MIQNMTDYEDWHNRQHDIPQSLDFTEDLFLRHSANGCLNDQEAQRGQTLSGQRDHGPSITTNPEPEKWRDEPMMYLNNLMEQRKLSRNDLVRMSGIPDSTLRDILNGKTRLDHCKADTLMRLASALNLPAEELLAYVSDKQGSPDEDVYDEPRYVQAKTPMSYFYFIVDIAAYCLRKEGAASFLRYVFNEHWIEECLRVNAYREALFFLGLTDYLCRKHGMKTDPFYESLRKFRLDEAVYSLDTLLKSNNSEAIARARANAEQRAIPELARHNIFLTPEDIRLKA